MARLQGRTALVTGANRGIGLAIAKALGKEGATVLLAGRKRSALDKVRKEIEAAGGKAALESLVRIYVAERGDSPLRINMVSPGPTRTEMRARAAPEEDPMTIKAPDAIAPLFVALSTPECQIQGKWIDADEWLSGKFKL